jgi:hypothetical protein
MVREGGGAARHTLPFERCNTAIVFAHFRQRDRIADTSPRK